MRIKELPGKYQGQARQKYSKYRSKKTEYDGRTFDSRKEAQRYAELKMLQKAGEISGLECQKPYELIPTQRDATGKLLERKTTYIADFVYTRDGKTVVEDVKGFRTPEYKLKRKMMLYKYGIQIQEV